MLYNAPPAQLYRTVFLSDLHMGAKSFDAPALLKFLQSVECKTLYLVGDIIDGWKLKKRWYWTESCSAIIDELIRKSHNGTKIVYLPGNHDDEIRRINPLMKYQLERQMQITITDKTVHRCADGKRFLILHGDQFDRAILRGPLSRWSDYLYDRWLDLINGHSLEHIRIDGRMKPFSLAKALGLQGQRALQLLNNFEQAVWRMASARQVDGLICGHTHIPVIKTMRGITYANAGSWLRRGHTALAETFDGVLTLIDWPESFAHPLLFNPACQQEAPNVRIVEDSARYRPMTERVIRRIRALWHPPLPRPSRLRAWRLSRPPQIAGLFAQDTHKSLHKMTDIHVQTV